MKTLVLITVFFLAVSFGIPVAMADTFQLKFDNVFSGSAPSGSGPWLFATFTDAGANTVNLSVSATNLVTSEFVSELYLNNLISPISSFALTNPTGATATGSYNSNHFKADGDGYYDINISFPTSNSPSSNRFTGGEVFTATLAGTGLTAASFNSGSVGGEKGSFLAAAHVQGGNGGSAWVGATPNAVPEPVSTVLFLMGGATLVARRFRKKASKV